MRADKLQKLRRVHVWPDRIEAAYKNLIAQIDDYTSDDINCGLAVRLIKGQEVEIDGCWYRSSAEGNLLRSRSVYVAAGKDKGLKENLLSRINVLIGLIKAKMIMDEVTKLRI